MKYRREYHKHLHPAEHFAYTAPPAGAERQEPVRHLAVDDVAVGALREEAFRPEVVDVIPDACVVRHRPQVDEDERVTWYVVTVESDVSDGAVRQCERDNGRQPHHLEYGRLGARDAQTLGMRGRAVAADDIVDVALYPPLFVRVHGHVQQQPQQRRGRRVRAGRDELDGRAQQMVVGESDLAPLRLVHLARGPHEDVEHVGRLAVARRRRRVLASLAGVQRDEPRHALAELSPPRTPPEEADPRRQQLDLVAGGEQLRRRVRLRHELAIVGVVADVGVLAEAERIEHAADRQRHVGGRVDGAVSVASSGPQLDQRRRLAPHHRLGDVAGEQRA